MKNSHQDLEVKSKFTKNSTHLKVTIRQGSLITSCEGSADEVVKFVLRFIQDISPNYEIINGLILTVDLERLLRGLKGVVSFLPKGRPVILKSTEKLTDSDLTLTYLVAAYAGNQIGIAENDHLSMADLLDKTGKPAGTIAGRLSELVGKLYVERVGRGKYRVTSYGVQEFMKEILPKLVVAK